MDELYYQIALTKVEWIGSKLARLLLSNFGTVENIFKATENQLTGLGGFGHERVKALRKAIDEKEIEKEIAFIERNQIKPLFISHKEYPKLLKECPDAPILLYYKGNHALNSRKTVAIVGTRNNTDYGRQITEDLVEGLKGQSVMIVSGLASGIDGIAHKAALKNNLPTVGVLGHGLDRIYPVGHSRLAGEMIESGGLLTEYSSGIKPDKQNFPRRNRIVSGMADVVVVIETAEKGGSMITAKLASSYNREVAAFPGRSIDNRSGGCNYLIKTNIAHLITNADDLVTMMNWQKNESKNIVIQRKLFATLSPEEKKVTDALDSGKEIHIDELMLKTAIPDSKMAVILLSLELDGLVRSLPGKRYRLA